VELAGQHAIRGLNDIGVSGGIDLQDPVELGELVRHGPSHAWDALRSSFGRLAE